jgi:hypothetical protein
VARRPEPETILTREQLEAFTRRLLMLSDDGVERIYEETYRECAFKERILPPAAAIQQFGGFFGGVIGGVVGQRKSFQYRLQEQVTLGQMQIEHNSHRD